MNKFNGGFLKAIFYKIVYYAFLALPECRFRQLAWGAFCKFGFLAKAPDEWYWKLVTYIVAGEPYGLPGKGGGINSVIRWQQLYWPSPLKTLCSDKFAVRAWVSERIGSQYLVPLLPREGVFWTDTAQIDFNALPNRFVMKLNNGSGMNLIVQDKSKLNLQETITKLNDWLNTNFTTLAREHQYAAIDNKLMCEAFIETPDGKPPRDYKLMCSNGKLIFVWVDFDRFGDHRRNFYDPCFNRIVLEDASKPQSDVVVDRPKNWDDMVRVAKILSAGIPLVRVDLYNIDGRIYFGELTFTSDQGTGIFKPLSQSQAWAAEVDLSPFMKS